MSGAPILRIPVDDEAFKGFLKAFQKYADQAEEQPEVWAGINEQMRGAAIAGAALAESINEQAEAQEKVRDAKKKVAQEEKEEARQKREAARLAKSDADKQERDDKARMERRKDAIKDLGKWIIGGGAIAGIAAGLSGWGIDKFMGATSDERRSAQGMGVSIGQRQYANSNLSRYFDVDSGLSRMANMQGDPTSWQPFAALGINPQGKDPLKLLEEAALKARAEYIRTGGNLANLKNEGITDLFSAEELRRLAINPESDIRKSFNDTNKMAGRGPTDADAKKLQDDYIKLQDLKVKLENKFVMALAKVDEHGTLSMFTDKLGQFADRVLTPQLFEKLGDAVDMVATKLTPELFATLGDAFKNFTDYISSDGFKEDTKNFVDDIKIMAAAIHWVVDTLPSSVKKAVNYEKKAHDWEVKNVDPLLLTMLNPGIALQKIGPVLAKQIGQEATAAGNWFASFFGGQAGSSRAGRNNNPGNIMGGGGYNRYGSLAEGAARMAKQILIDYDAHGSDTIRKLIDGTDHPWSSHLAPGNSVASTNNYIDTVARELGVTPDTKLNFHDQYILKNLMRSMSGFESGHKMHVRIDNHTGGSVSTTTAAAAGGGTGK